MRPRSHGRFVSVAVLGVVVAATAAIAAPAHADASNWWYTTYNVAAARAAGITGEGVKVAVIDAQINPALPVLQGADLTVAPTSVCKGNPTSSTASDAAAHGTDVTALLVGNGTGDSAVQGIAPRAKVTFYSMAGSVASVAGKNAATGCTAGTLPNGQKITDIGASVREAVAAGNRIISMSLASYDLDPGDVTVIADAVARGVVIVAGQPNKLSNEGQRYPADLNGVVAVNAFAQDGTLQTAAGQSKPTAWLSTTVVAPGVDFPSVANDDPWAWAPGGSVTGSSLATPLVAGMLADTLQKYPDATGNQLIQSLIRNTGATDHALSRSDDGLGYGAASLSHLLRVDPTTYPDTNPLLDKPHGVGKPTAAQFRAAADALAHPSAGARPTATPSTHPGGGGGGLPVWAIVLVAGILALLVVVVIVVLLVVRSNRPKNGAQP